MRKGPREFDPAVGLNQRPDMVKQMEQTAPPGGRLEELEVLVGCYTSTPCSLRNTASRLTGSAVIKL
jgi:hypothetical protein